MAIHKMKKVGIKIKPSYTIVKIIAILKLVSPLSRSSISMLYMTVTASFIYYLEHFHSIEGRA